MGITFTVKDQQVFNLWGLYFGFFFHCCLRKKSHYVDLAVLQLRHPPASASQMLDRIRSICYHTWRWCLSLKLSIKSGRFHTFSHNREILSFKFKYLSS